MATAPAGDELVASAVPDANKALHAGHLLYAVEMRVTIEREKLAHARAPRIRQMYKQRLVEAVERRNRLDDTYREALAAVRAANHETADLVDDAVWRIHLINGEV